MARKDLAQAKDAKKDEFYTQLSDIEKELIHYRDYFRDKVIFCNCDDPYESNFFKYFALNFNALGLKKLIATCYDGSPIAQQELPLFEEAETEPKRLKSRSARLSPEGGKTAGSAPYGRSGDKKLSRAVTFL